MTLQQMRFVLAGLLTVGLVATTAAQGLRGAKPADVKAEQPIDGIAAVVNDEVVTVLQVRERAQDLGKEIRAEGQPMPPQDALLKNALDELITQTVVAQEAKKMGLQVSQGDIDRTVARVAERNRVSVAQVRNQVSRMGLDWNEYEESLKRQILFDMVRQRMADRTVRVSDADVDAFIQERAARKESGLEPPPPPPPPPPKPPAPRPLVFQLAQIFVSVPEFASEGQVAELRQEIDDARAQIRKGADFAAVARSVSDGPEAANGGDMGVRPASGWPDLFVKAARNLQAGQISQVVRSPAGFHILKVIGRAGGQQAAAPPPPQVKPQDPTGPMMVDQTKARHILIKTSAVISDDQAKQRLLNARSRIVQGGESFDEVARAVSQDNSAPMGGDLGWLNPGETVPEFERAMDSLQPGEVSEAVKTQYGWHLILVEERRTQDMADQYRRNLARQEIYSRRAGSQFDAWLQQMRNMSYIDNRMFRPTAQ